MPLEQPAMRLMVPVGARLLTVALRRGGCPRWAYTLRGKLGNGPLSWARAAEAMWDSVETKDMVLWAISTAWTESYGMPI